MLRLKNGVALYVLMQPLNQKGEAMARNEKTGVKAGKAASSVLRDGRTSKASKTAAASALTQRPNKKK